MPDGAASVLVPLLNPNEPDAVLVEIMVSDGDQVAEGDVICALETSKSVEEVAAEGSGFVAGLAVELGATVTAGDVLFYLATDPTWVAPVVAASAEATADGPEALKITDPARKLALELGVDLHALPLDVFITESKIREFAGGVESPAATAPTTDGPAVQDVRSRIDPTAVVIFGGGGHGRTLIELVLAVGSLRPVAIVDDGLPLGSDVLGVPVVGGKSALATVRRDGTGLAVNALGGISNMAQRVQTTELLEAGGFALPALLHPSAVVEPSARIGAGAQVLAQAYVGSAAEIGAGVIVNTRAVVSHDCIIGAHANLSPGCLLAGGVTVGARSLLGMGVATFLGLDIGSDARIGNNTVVNAAVPDGRLIRAGSVWDGDTGLTPLPKR